MHQEKLLCLVFLSFCAGYSSEFTTIGPKILQPTSTNQDLIVSSTSDKLDTDLVSISDVTTLSTTSETVLSTLAPSTLAPSTLAPSTLAPSTLAPSTQAPSPPKPSVWVVVDKDTNVTCIVIKLVAIIIIPSNTTDGQPRNTSFNLPSNASSNGTCHRNSAEFADQQVLSLNWIDEFQHFNNLTFVFEKNITRSDGKEQFYLSDLYLNRNSGNVSYFFNKHLNGSIQAVEVNNSYRCNTEDTLKMDPNLENLTIFPSYLRLSHVQMEAFRTQSNDEFGLAMDCAADRIVTSDIVPIAVGCALAALVVIVLVAYLIGRRRARQRGYQSV